MSEHQIAGKVTLNKVKQFSKRCGERRKGENAYKQNSEYKN